MKIPIPALVAVAAFAAGTSAWARPAPQAVAAAWAGEDRYWAASTAGDFPTYLTLFDDGFTAWPCNSAVPRAKSTVTRETSGLPPPGVARTVALDEKEATGTDSVVVVFYRARLTETAPDRAPKVTVRNFTHTWIATPEGWRIIGGMCREERPLP